MTSFLSPNALVTGAGRRIGRAIALGLAEDGWDVALHANRSLEDAQAACAEIEAMGQRGAVVSGDLAQADDASLIIDHAR
ncbi:MAG: SDR family NAD(P)-dependent oxidoreductase, partial [Geminicoccaceae bacterium]